MEEEKKNMFLFEAIELRASLDAEIATFKKLLDEPTQHRKGFISRDENVKRPVEGFSLSKIKEEIDILKDKRRKLNGTIQHANHENHVTVDGQKYSLAELLDLRSELNNEIGKLSDELIISAFEEVVHKEERDIVVKPYVSFTSIYEELKRKRANFLKFNRALQKANHVVIIAFDEGMD